MTNKKKLGLLMVALVLVAGVFFFAGRIIEKHYTYDELYSMPADELYALFERHGLQVSDRMEAVLTEEQRAEYLKTEFSLLVQGITRYSDEMYKDFADEVQRVYEVLTGAE